MKEPVKWFEVALNSGNYDKDVVAESISCISENRFNIDKFMDWTFEQLNKGLGED